jgi:hypothetical protein
MGEKCIQNIDRELVREEVTFLWLQMGDLTAETGSQIIEAQDQAVETKYDATKGLKTERGRKCRLH